MKQVPLDETDQVADMEGDEMHRTHQVLPDIAYQRVAIVNVVYFGETQAAKGEWVLIDSGLPGTGKFIKRAIAERFGEGSHPACIILTHAHADHAGSLEALVQEWNVPVYAHPLELPYLNGEAAYPPPDTHVGGGLMPKLAPLFPRGPFNVSRWLQPLPSDNSVPHMPLWKWIHTPGHTPGHISLWNPTNRVLIAGDAFITTNQESVYAVIRQKPEMHGPPMYYTQNFLEAEESVRKLAALEPELVVTGHGHAMEGEQMRSALHLLARDFKALAVPPQGKYVAHPVSAADGTAYVLNKS